MFFFFAKFFCKLFFFGFGAFLWSGIGNILFFCGFTSSDNSFLLQKYNEMKQKLCQAFPADTNDGKQGCRKHGDAGNDNARR